MKIFKRFKKIYFYRNILKELTVKNLKTKYSGSMLGIWWAIITPLILAISINFVFSVVFNISIKNFALFALSGILPWIFFSNALFETTDSFLVNSQILKQAVFPIEFIPLSSILSNFLSFLLGLSVLLPLFIIFNLKVLLMLPLLFLIFLLHLLFLSGLGFLFSVLNVFLRDVSCFLSIGLMIWFWLTPIFYPIEFLRFPYRWICLFNPLTYYIISYQKALFKGEFLSFSDIFIILFISLLSFIGGYSFFIKKEKLLLKRI